MVIWQGPSESCGPGPSVHVSPPRRAIVDLSILLILILNQKTKKICPSSWSWIGLPDRWTLAAVPIADRRDGESRFRGCKDKQRPPRSAVSPAMGSHLNSLGWSFFFLFFWNSAGVLWSTDRCRRMNAMFFFFDARMNAMLPGGRVLVQSMKKPSWDEE
jgi:hypothetical protein